MTGDAQAAIDALRAGEPVILPTDTVYGLVAAAEGPGPTQRLYLLKGRAAAQPRLWTSSAAGSVAQSIVTSLDTSQSTSECALRFA